MRRVLQSGFTLIELLVFIVVSSFLMTIILLSATVALQKGPSVHHQWVGVQAVRGCMEYFLDQRRLNGYAALSCPSTPSTANCAAPAGYTLSASVACTTYSSDSNYQTITVSVSGLATTSMSVMIGSY